MFYYALSIVAGGIYLLLSLGRNKRPGKSYFLLSAFLLLLFGFFQRNIVPFDTCLIRFARWLLRFLLEAAPYALTVFSAVAVYHAARRLQRRGWSRKYAAVVGGGIALLLANGLIFANRVWFRRELLYTLESLVDGLFLYLTATFFAFVSLSFLYRFVRPHADKDYIIVLGTGLLPDGSLSLLLRNRLDEALRYYRFQTEQSEKRPKIIVSGGKGYDEPWSEAEAMGKYLREKGIPAECILMEDRSINTHQNFLYSKELMERRAEGTEAVFITNNFHVLRSGFYARQMGVMAEGIGAKTPLYYLPYALVREYIALVLMHWQVHVVAVLSFLALALWMGFER